MIRSCRQATPLAPLECAQFHSQGHLFDDIKMASIQEKTLTKSGSRGTKCPNILEIFIA